MRLLHVLLAASLVMTGCFDDDDNDIGREQFELNVNRATWNDANIGSYRFTQRISCFCPPEDDIIVVVMDGSVTEGLYEPSGKSVSPERLASLRTIDGFLDLIQESIIDAVEVLNVEYDATRGFPTDIFIDRSTMIADEEVAYSLRDFQETSF